MFRVCCVCFVLLASAAHSDAPEAVERQVSSKRREHIMSLKKIISLSADAKEQPSLLFRLGELYWAESKFYFLEAKRKDDKLFEAMNRGDTEAQERAKAGKAELLTRMKQYGKLAIEQYMKIVQEYPDFERSDEVLFFLGTYLMEDGQDRKALVAYDRLTKTYPESKYIPDAHLEFGEYYFNNAKGKRPGLEKALAAYKKAAEFPESQVYAFALYKQGWCYFNLGDYTDAKDKWKAVMLYGEQASATGVEKDGASKKGSSALVREARNDYVRAYAREGDVMLAREDFFKVATNPDDRFGMMKHLANRYYADGKDREAVITYNSLLKEKPLSPEAPGFQSRIVDIVLRMGNKERTVTQVRRLVKLMKEVESSGVVKDEKDKKALAEAKGMAERTLSNLAVTWHDEAKKTREAATIAYADTISSDYLTLFPESIWAPEILKLREELRGPSPGEAGATSQMPSQPLPLEKADVQEYLRRRSAHDKEVIQTVIRSHTAEIRTCFEFALVRNPSLEGRVAVKFTIDAEGSVISSEIFQSSVGNEQMESCIAKVVKLWSFPKHSAPGGHVVVTYSFIFRLEPTLDEQQP